jgi:thiamine monophosphate kinase
VIHHADASAKALISGFPADAEVFADELVGGEQTNSIQTPLEIVGELRSNTGVVERDSVPNDRNPKEF